MKEKTQKFVVGITGAHGFIGKHLINHLLEQRGDILIRSLVRNPDPLSLPHINLTEIQGDLSKPETLSNFLLPECTVINLAYGFDLTQAENLYVVGNLIEICKKNQVRRLIHCSTASVYGHSKENKVDEESVCNPRLEYGRTKLLIEQVLQEGAHGNFEFVNLRPTSIFGIDGLALSTLVDSFLTKGILLNYLKSCLFGTRKLNLVSVETVVAAIIFICDKNQGVDGQTFIVSEDNESINNFEYVEKYLFKTIYSKYYYFPPVKIPLIFLAFILKFKNRDNYNPNKFYDSSKIRKLGFNPPQSLATSLTDFAQWKKSRYN